jgi:Na+/H+-dicarboxylate symporter
MLAVVVLGVLVGIAALQVDRDKVAPFLRLLDALLSIAMIIVKWAMFLAPLAVFGLMAQLVMRIGLGRCGHVGLCRRRCCSASGLLMALYLAIIAIVGAHLAGLVPRRTPPARCCSPSRHRAPRRSCR